MKSLGTATVLLLGATSAMAQTLDQTFEQLGSKLQAAQQSLNSAPAPSLGSTLVLPTDAPVFTRPQAGAATPLKFDANTPVIFQGIENGFVKIGSPALPGVVYYVPTEAISRAGWKDVAASTETAAGNQLKKAIDTLRGIATDLQQNPYIRVKGFSVNVSLMPSLNIDFEMRQAAVPSDVAPPAKP
jgi:hypothetical protein